jgi:hypothetical protein
VLNVICTAVELRIVTAMFEMRIPTVKVASAVAAESLPLVLETEVMRK